METRGGTGRTGRRGWKTAALAGITAIAAACPGVVRGEDALRLDPIVVTATRTEQRVSEVAASVSVVTREEIEERMPAVVGDALQGVPGIVVQRSGSPGSLENIKIRGGLAPHTLVLIDGFPVNSPTLGQFDIGALPADAFERIEVVRGAQSALYGSNAIGGVVNFIPRKGEDGMRYGIDAAAGSFDTVQGSGFVQGGGRPGRFHLGASGFRSDGILPNDETSLVSVLGVGEAAVGRRNRLHAVALYTDLEKGIPVDFGTPRDENHELHRWSVLSGLRWETDVAEAVTVMASGMIFEESFRQRDPADPGEVFPFVFESDTDTRKTLFRLEGRISPAPVSTTFVGVEYLKDRGANTFRTDFDVTDLSESVINRSLYVQEEIRLRERTGMSLGARLDDNAKAGTELNPRAAAYHMFERTGIRIRAAVGRGFRVPTILEEFDAFVGNPLLGPETAVSYEAGSDIPIGKRVSLSATYFYKDFDDLIQFDDSVPGPAGFGELRNVGRAFARGIESEAWIRLLAWAEVGLAYTYTDTWDASNQRRILGIPTQRGTASLQLSPVPALQVRIDGLVESDQLDVHASEGDVRTRPGYARVDASARYRWKLAGAPVRDVALTGRVRKLPDRDYEERLGIPAPGIHFLLGVEARI
jgi:vitamin B12 transporter